MTFWKIATYLQQHILCVFSGQSCYSQWERSKGYWSQTSESHTWLHKTHMLMEKSSPVRQDKEKNKFPILRNSLLKIQKARSIHAILPKKNRKEKRDVRFFYSGMLYSCSFYKKVASLVNILHFHRNKRRERARRGINSWKDCTSSGAEYRNKASAISALLPCAIARWLAVDPMDPCGSLLVSSAVVFISCDNISSPSSPPCDGSTRYPSIACCSGVRS